MPGRVGAKHNLPVLSLAEEPSPALNELEEGQRN